LAQAGATCLRRRTLLPAAAADDARLSAFLCVARAPKTRLYTLRSHASLPVTSTTVAMDTAVCREIQPLSRQSCSLQSDRKK